MPDQHGASGHQQGGADDTFRVSPPQLSLPNGGGAIRGIGEKFAANPVTGTGSLSISIYTSPGRSGFGPQLSLSYDSGAGNGPFGFGWHLALPSISRKTDKGLPKYQDAVESDTFILSGAEDLVPVLQQHENDWIRGESFRVVDNKNYRIQRYRPRIEGLFSRIERWTNQTDPTDTYWRSISRDNITTRYGKTAESRIADPDDASHIFSWLICESYDDKGNLIVYRYKAEDASGVSIASVHERNRSDAQRAANRYLKRIRYGNRQPYLPDLQDASSTPLPTEWLFELVFDYSEHAPAAPEPDTETRVWDLRNDPFSTYRAGFDIRTYRLCQRVLMFHHFPDEPEVRANCLVRSTDLTYSYEGDPTSAQNPIFSFLLSVSQSGYRRDTRDGYLRQSLPALEFEYSKATISAEVREVDAASLEHLPIGLDGASYQWVDLDGEGLAGILTEQAGTLYYKRNLSPAPVLNGPEAAPPAVTFGPVELVAQQPSLLALSSGRQQWLDLAGDGKLDLVAFDGPVPGFYERTPDDGWEPFKSFASLPRIDWANPNLRFVDLTGDGHADILITEDDALSWYPSLAEAGFAPPEKVWHALDEEWGPRLLLADGTHSVYLADMSGDGLTDLVRIRNGEVCYWPNLGYGRFGARVSMDNAPWFDHPDQFDQRRIRLADIDGSGVTDIVYLAENGVSLYFNQSGNSWAPSQILPAFPTLDNVASIQVVDLLGNGTACLVWSSPLAGHAQQPMRYVDLMGGQKPHLLIQSVNNLGAETRIAYAPSTRFSLADTLAGRPWVTRLPFPVHVVERVETYDRLSGNRFVTRYAYHHGYFDGIEREFRGFGMVEQWDTESIAALSQSAAFPVGDNIDPASHVPPVHTKTWFHTGVSLRRDHVSDFFAGLLDAQDTGEYYREPGLTDQEAASLGLNDEARRLYDDAQAKERLLEDTVLPAGFTHEEEHEACRALKGAMLRQEVYALDGTTQTPHPYTITEQNFTIRLLQPKAGNRHGVFFAHAREAVSSQYERHPLDPRVSHALTLEVDDVGNVLRSAAIGYGRRRPDPMLSTADQAMQTALLVTCTENDFTNAIDMDDAYRTPLPSESRTYELGGLQLAEDRTRLGFGRVHNAMFSATPLAYEGPLTEGLEQKRLIEHVLTRYRPNNLGRGQNGLLDLLPRGQLESLAVPGEIYKLALTPGLVTKVYGTRVTDTVLAAEGRYVHRAGDMNWWIPSGRVFFSPGTHDDAETELAYARAHFFLPHRFRDPFHTAELPTESFVTYDYDLLVQETRDACGNVTTAIHDYRMLRPRLLTDPNGNRSAVAFDTLGMVIGTAVMGKPLPAPIEGDALDGFEVDLTEAVMLDHLAHPLTDPHAILRRATTRLVYDLFAYRRTRNDPQPQPATVYTLARETHEADLRPGEQTKIQHSFSYSDGFGREMQKKIQAEPGPLVQGGPEVRPRWVGSGWSVFNNKGKPVRQFEPFFTDTHCFEFDVRRGVSPIIFYDPVERVVATLHPNHTYAKVVFDPWRQTTYDVNDTVTANGTETGDPRTDADIQGYVAEYFKAQPDTWQTWYQQRIAGAKGAQEQRAAEKAAQHANTPTTVHFDTLGRPFLTLAHNGFNPDGTPIQFPTRVDLDIEGNQRAMHDAVVHNNDPLGRIVMRYDYDMLGNRVYSASMEAGERWMLNDVAGQPIHAWDARGHEFRTEYDRLHRPKNQFVRGIDPNESDARVLNREVLFQKTEYGEDQPNGVALNLRTRAFRSYDNAGIVTSECYGFKGNLLRGNRQLALDYKGILDWSGTVDLEPELFASSMTYDALNRPMSLISPDNSEIRPTYNEANLLEKLQARLRGAAEWTSFVEDIDYNAKGQRELIRYGNGIETAYDYDPLTFRLITLKTTRDSDGDLQHLFYTYDPTGNITYIKDTAQQTIYFDNTQITADADYTYDAIHQLIEATGREHIGQIGQVDHNDPPIHPLPHPNAVEAMQRYTEQYQYDAVGNILAMIHQANGGNWTRHYQYAANSNRLLATSLPSDAPAGPYTDKYEYNLHGSMARMPHLPLIAWDFAERMQASSKQVFNGGTPETTYYVYDASGQRVRKITERQAAEGTTPTRTKGRIYLGGFEVYQEYDGSGTNTTLERETLHVMDDKQRIALIETKYIDNQHPIPNPQCLIRYQLGNHLSSASLELDDAGQVISYEEYHPYGTTSFRAANSAIEVSAKRYRYTGEERDEENGLYYHGARYYAPWLGRWTSADPVGTVDGVNLFTYAMGNPINGVDSSGTQTEDLEASIKGLKHNLWWNNQLNGLKDENGLRDAYVDKSNVTIDQLARAIVGYYEGGAGATETARSTLGISVDQWKIAESVYFNQRVAAGTDNMSQKEWNSTLRGPNLDIMRENVAGAIASAATLRVTGDVHLADALGQAGAGLFGARLAAGSLVLSAIQARAARTTNQGSSEFAYQGAGLSIRSWTLFGTNTGPTPEIRASNCVFCTVAGQLSPRLTSSQAAASMNRSEGQVLDWRMLSFRFHRLGLKATYAKFDSLSEAKTYMRNHATGEVFAVGYKPFGLQHGHVVGATNGPLGVYFRDFQTLLALPMPFILPGYPPKDVPRINVWNLTPRESP